jgi:hypothetical protein
VSVHRLPSPATTADRPVGLSSLRGIEAAELLRVITALRRDGMLTESEYQAKRRRLIAVD